MCLVHNLLGQSISNVVVRYHDCFVCHVLTSFHLACNVNYHNNFSVHGLKRIYYGGVPKYIQVGEHQFVEDKLAIHWMDLMLNV